MTGRGSLISETWGTRARGCRVWGGTSFWALPGRACIQNYSCFWTTRGTRCPTSAGMRLIHICPLPLSIINKYTIWLWLDTLQDWTFSLKNITEETLYVCNILTGAFKDLFLVMSFPEESQADSQSLKLE